MPPAPNYIDKFNAITRFIDNPCFAPWTVYFETALPFIGQGVMTLFEFDLFDILRGYYRPRLGKKGRHGGFRKNRRKPRFGIPEIGEMIGENLPGGERLKGRFVDDGVRHLWMIDGVIQRVFYYWMIADISVDIVYNTMMAIQTTEFCAKQGNGQAKSHVGGRKIGAGLCRGFTNWEWIYPFSGPVFSGAVGSPARPAFAIGSGSVIPDFGAEGWLSVIVPGGQGGRSSSFTGLIPGLPFQAVARGYMPAGKAAALELCGNGGVNAEDLQLASVPI